MNNVLPGLAQRLAELARGSVQSVAPLSPVGEQLPEFEPGQRYTARILHNLQDGRTRAQIAGQTVTLQLPQGVAEGTTVRLTHVTRNAQTLVATLTPDVPETTHAAVQLSQPARAIGALLDQPAPPPARFPAGQPLIDPATAGTGVRVADASATPQIASRLAAAIEQSGLFYESHQAQWISGERAIESTAAEPQRAFDPAPLKPRAMTRIDTVESSGENPSERPDTTVATPVRERVEIAGSNATTPGELRPLVQNQLLGLSQHTLAWEGLAWPGQLMKIEIDDPQRNDSSDDRTTDAAGEVPWTSRLRLVLPGLGEIETSLTLWRDHGVALGVSADAEARARMGSTLLDLQQRMSDAGLRLNGVTFTETVPTDESVVPVTSPDAARAGVVRS